MIDLVFQNLTSDKKYDSKFFEKILIAGELKLQARPGSQVLPGKNIKNIGISVNLVGEGKMQELNNKYRHKNKVTDVLSFPISNEIQSLPAYGPMSLLASDIGDIFICLPFAKKEAKRENVSIEKKLAQLTIHGFLHLLGYDHENSVIEAKKMEKLEKTILSSLNF